MDADPDYLLTAAAARELQCTPDGVGYLDRTGRLPAAMRVNGVRIFRRTDVDRLRRERQTAPGPRRRESADSQNSGDHSHAQAEAVR